MLDLQIDGRVVEYARVLCGINPDFEWVGELWGFIDGNSIEITDLLLSKQRVSETAVNQGLSEDEKRQLHIDTRYYHMLNNKISSNKRLIGWIHSHNIMGLYLSSTDRAQIMSYFNNDNNIEFIISIVVSSKDSSIKRQNMVSRIRKYPKQNIPDIAMKMWIDGVYNKMKFHNRKLSIDYYYRSNSMNSYISIEFQDMVRKEYSDLVVIDDSSLEMQEYTELKKSPVSNASYFTDFI